MKRALPALILAFTAIALSIGAFYAVGSYRRQSKLAPLSAIETNVQNESLARLLHDLKAAIERRPEHARAWGELGLALLANEMTRPASTCFARAEELDPESAIWPHLYGRSVMEFDAEDGKKALRRAMARNPASPVSATVLAEILLEDGSLDEANAIVEQLYLGNHREPHVLFLKARIEAEHGRVEAAIKLAEECDALAPGRRIVHQLLARLYERSGDRAKGSRAARLLKLLPKQDVYAAWPDPYVGDSLRYARRFDHVIAKVKSYVEAGRPGDAVWILDNELSAGDRDHPVALAAYSLALLHLGDSQAAQKKLDQASVRNPGSSQVFFAQGVFHLANEDVVKAEASFAEAARLDPAADAAHFNQALCLLRLEKKKEALDALHRAIEANPANKQALRTAAAVLVESGKLDEARSRIEDLLLLDPKHELTAELKRLAGK